MEICLAIIDQIWQETCIQACLLFRPSWLTELPSKVCKNALLWGKSCAPISVMYSTVAAFQLWFACARVCACGAHAPSKSKAYIKKKKRENRSLYSVSETLITKTTKALRNICFNLRSNNECLECSYSVVVPRLYASLSQKKWKNKLIVPMWQDRI